MQVDIPEIPGTQIALPDEFDRLYDIANNIWWTWDDEAEELWSRIDPQRWLDVGHPISFLQGVDTGTWETLSGDARFLDLYASVIRRFDNYMTGADTWTANQIFPMPGPVAYLCTEYGLHHRMPFYSGGLGVLAGDHLKSASDLGIPMVAVGVLYRRGYFRQAVDPQGDQQHYYPAVDISRRPIHPIAGPGGGQLKVKVDFPGRTVHVAAWKVQVGRVPLIMLDTDLRENDPADRPITHLLYVRGREMRLAQELILGVGGVKVLRKLGIRPAVWHVNEGHAAFSVLERAARRIREGATLEGAQMAIRTKTLFTLHTPVPAGNERFDLGSVLRYTDYLFPEIDSGSIANLGKVNEHDDGAFDMGALAIRFSSFVNGVSKRHGEVATEQWSHLVGAPVRGVTNGVHAPTWIGHSMRRVFDGNIGADWQEKMVSSETFDVMRKVHDDELWNAHLAQKDIMMRRLRRRIRNQFGRHGASPDTLREVTEMLPTDRLTIGFARRFATYKRATLLLHDLPRLQAILTHPERPVQVVFAGKAHPADQGGQELIRRVVELSQRPEFRGHLFFIEDYDMEVGGLLTGGCDVWLNNPVPPKEASGTSGMKSALNGGLNLSVPDGWWAESVIHGQNGWSFGPEGLAEHGDDADSGSLYHVLENEVIPLFYQQDEDGIPKGWVAMMKEAIVDTAYQFSAYRMLIDYAQKAYFPLAEAALTEARGA